MAHSKGPWAQARRDREKLLAEGFDATLKASRGRTKKANVGDEARVALARLLPGYRVGIMECKLVGKTMQSITRHLVKMVVARYPMPAFILDELGNPGNQDHIHRATRLQGALIRIVQGGSFHKELKEVYQAFTLTKKMSKMVWDETQVHRLPPYRRGFTDRVRFAQLLASGNRVESSIHILDHRIMEEDEIMIPLKEAWLWSMFQWFANQAMLDPNQVGPILDFIAHILNEDEQYSLKGRTALTVLRAMEEWHAELNVQREQFRMANRAPRQRRHRRDYYVPPTPANVDMVLERPPGIKGYEKVVETRLKSGGKIKQLWTIVPILTYTRLAGDSSYLSHCGTSYWASMAKGLKSMWSMSVSGEVVATIEVKTNRIHQARGRFNSALTNDELRHMKAWAASNVLTI